MYKTYTTKDIHTVKVAFPIHSIAMLPVFLWRFENIFFSDIENIWGDLQGNAMSEEEESCTHVAFIFFSSHSFVKLRLRRFEEKVVKILILENWWLWKRLYWLTYSYLVEMLICKAANDQKSEK